MTYLTTEAELRDTIGTPPNTIYLKKLKVLEEHSRRYLEMSDLIAISGRNIPTRIGLIATEKTPPIIMSDSQFSITMDGDDSWVVPLQNEPVGMYILIAGFEESLRINGLVCFSKNSEGQWVLRVDISEHYFHCAKSIKRAQFWVAQKDCLPTSIPLQEEESFNKDINDFILKASFLLLATENDKGEADLSPRGDPAGFLRVLDDNRVLIPERPGNKIADSLRNILINSSMAIIVFIPGSKQTLILTGSGKLTKSTALLGDSEFNGKTPKLGVVLSVEKIFFGTHSVLNSVDFWNKAEGVDRSVLPSLGLMIGEQLQTIGKVPGGESTLGRWFGKAVGAATDIAIKHDYKKNLY